MSIIQFPNFSSDVRIYEKRLEQSNENIGKIVDILEHYNLELIVEIQNYNSIYTSMVQNCNINVPYQLTLEFSYE